MIGIQITEEEATYLLRFVRYGMSAISQKEYEDTATKLRTFGIKLLDTIRPRIAGEMGARYDPFMNDYFDSEFNRHKTKEEADAAEAKLAEARAEKAKHTGQLRLTFMTAGMPEDMFQELYEEQSVVLDGVGQYTVAGFVTEAENAADVDKASYPQEDIDKYKQIDDYFIAGGAVKGQQIFIEHG